MDRRSQVNQIANPTGENPFLQTVLNRTASALRRLRAGIWTKVCDLPVEATACLSDSVDWDTAKKLPLQRLTLPCEWGKLYEHRWFKIHLPEERPAKCFLEWQSHGQATAWVAGRPYHGFDNNHRQMKVPEGLTEIWVESVCIPSFTEPPEPLGSDGARCDSIRLLIRDDDAWKGYQRLTVLFELAMEERMEVLPAMGRAIKRSGHQPAIAQARPLYRRLLRHLDRCGNAFDKEGTDGLQKALDAVFSDLNVGSGFNLQAILSGHAHIDLVWLWPERIGHFKARHSFANALRLMEEYPEFRFQYSQTASYAAVRSSAPLLMKEVSQRISEGRWEASGALEVESDTLLPCGEALARSFVLGQRRFLALTGSISPLLWLPDVFGYSGCLPQLMREFGIKYFFTTKLSWNVINQFPYSSFIWRGDDGSEVVAHLTQDIGYNNSMQIRELRTAERSYRQADVHNEFLVPTGFGDGGGGPTAEMCERARHAASLTGVPAVKWDVPIRFFERLAKCRPDLPTYQGELYFEDHRGTFTTQAKIKHAMRLAERALQAIEAAHVATGSGEIPEALWDRVVFAQFHDYIPGSSVPPVYFEALEDLSKITREALCAAEAKLAGKGELCRFNPLPLPVRIHLPGSKVLELPPLAGRPLSEARPIVPLKKAGKSRHLANSRVQAAFTPDGLIDTFLFDGKPVHLREGAGALWLFRDFPASHEAWDIERQALDTGMRVDTPLQVTEGTSGNGSAWIKFSRSVGNASTVEVVYSLVPESPLIHLEIHLDWHEENSWLKLVFPSDYNGKMARFGSPFGSTLRPQCLGDHHGEAMWEVPASRYGIAMDDAGAEGIFIITESKYGFSCRDGSLGVSLVRSPLHTGLDLEYDYMYPGHLRPGPEVPRHTDQGAHSIRMALGQFLVGAPMIEQPAALAETEFATVLDYSGSTCNCGFAGIQGDSLVPCWSQPLGESGWILRLHEVLGRKGTAVLLTHPGWMVERCRFDGSEGTPLVDMEVNYRAYEVVSLRFFRSRQAPENSSS
jgi:alpha-mannosidase